MSRDEDVIVDLTQDEAAPARPAGADDVVDEVPAVDLPKSARLNANGTVTLQLCTPVTVKVRSSDGKVTETVYEKLTMRRFNGADRRAIAQLEGTALEIEMFARACSIRNALMSGLYDKMDAYDIRCMGEVLSYFLENGPIPTSG